MNFKLHRFLHEIIAILHLLEPLALSTAIEQIRYTTGRYLLLTPNRVPRFQKAMDASILASQTAAAMPTNAIPSQQQHTIPPASSHSGIASAKTQKEPWPQPAYPEPLSNAPAASPSKSRIETRPPPPSRGRKRSATGEIKTTVHEDQTRSTRPSNGVNNHSRTTSVDSTGNRIAEVSQQLI